MYAIIEVGGKQERVKVGDELETEKLEGEKGTEIVIDKVLLIADNDAVKIGTPYVPGASVKVTIQLQTKAKKLYIYKFKAKSRYRRKTGHRQLQTVLKIESITS